MGVVAEDWEGHYAEHGLVVGLLGVWEDTEEENRKTGERIAMTSLGEWSGDWGGGLPLSVCSQRRGVMTIRT